MFLYKLLDLPQVPEELTTHGSMIESYVGWIHKRNGQNLFSADHPLYSISVELTEWINNNIYSNYNKIGIKHAKGSTEHPFIGIHTDATRQYVLQYNLASAGGVLYYWQEHNQPLIRDRRINLCDYEQVTLIEKCEIPDNTWHIINAMALHSVEGITGTRINIQLSLDHVPNFVVDA